MRILIFHGYLLRGTGSNVYNARLAAALVRLGHEVHLLSQDRRPAEQPFVDAVGDWDGGRLEMRTLREPVRCTVYRPDIGGLLPVYVADRYEGIEARTFAQCSDEEVAAYVEANVAAVAEVAARAQPQLALANHLVMGPVILARALGGEVPYAVKVHGSALEYTVKPEPERFLAAAAEGIAGARAVLVGSRHTAESLWEALGSPQVRERTRLGPPGVDVEHFRPLERGQAASRLTTLAQHLLAAAPDAEAADAPKSEDVFARDETEAGEALSRIDPERDLIVAFVGKLILSKGVDLLLAAWPLVLERAPRARLLIIGFGSYREGLERLRETLAHGDLEGALQLAEAGRSLEDPTAPPQPLALLKAFLSTLDGTARGRYLEAAHGLHDAVVLTGRLEHDELADVLPACAALVVPSTFPEAFGMVAAEAAACGVLPISAAHSGLLEVSRALAGAVPGDVAELLSFALDDDAVPSLAGRIVAWLGASVQERARAREGLVQTARERWSWEGVARGVIAAAGGDLAMLQAP